MTRARNLADFNTLNIDPSSLDDTGTIPSALLAGVGSTPLWKIWRSGSFSMATGVDTKVPFNTWSLDPDTVLNAASNRVTPAVAGKYFIQAQMRLDASTNLNMQYFDIRISGSNKSNAQVYHDHAGTVTTSLIADLSSSDYIECFAMQNSGGTINGMGGVMNTWIQGFKIA